ncbi:1,4-alpha-glucan branching protein GlgB [Candidatus Methylospira mobilis]|uniref:1,4-alpha-glucan branching protein GlgB n=1 Tax=Candidatus Methylospira mobilis TaxID=1808979 RepID=UPI0028F1308B|nr:1,4-alpha-glucan branching protein GlgB [Candidatus Methylospira mobilis]WNV06619.1 1,4-alpha-glucan branching protein GlgB [Candidatus Methylospira mobilis]
MHNPHLTTEQIRISEARHHDPFAVLGRHTDADGTVIRAFLPHATEVRIAEGGMVLSRLPDSALFEWRGDASALPAHYSLIWRDHAQIEHCSRDPYTFTPQISDFDLYLFGEGRHRHTYRFLGARNHQVDGVGGTLFAVWAPNAERVSVVGDFNRWDGRTHAMRVRGGSGVWELFIPDLEQGHVYKYEIRNRHDGGVLLKADPYGRQQELRPRTASIIPNDGHYQWRDDPWLARRATADWQHSPMSVYEVHPGSWRRDMEGEFLNYRELAHSLVDYVKDMGFTHIELMPITEHPFDLSWGYQATGYFAPTSRFGTPDDFRYFVDHCHQNGIGVLLDWVPAHFPKDAHGLARFDGTPLYEHADPRLGEHLDWATLIYNFGRNEVKNFLISSAVFWLQDMHIDGLRVDAVASMLYLDYSREEGQWVPNQYGGRENLAAVDFLKEINIAVHEECPGVLMIAEESTSWPQVSRPTYVGGLGFDLKWNMGWMNDTLRYMEEDPIHRQYHHGMITFSMLYAFTENFMLPFSHDEVVHGKGSMLNKMPGDEWQSHANLRTLYTYQFTHPGKKLLFMGTEFAQGQEWNSIGTLDWYVLDYPLHQGMRRMVKDINHLYLTSPALYRYEFDWQGFEWIDCNDNRQSILCYLRKGDGDEIMVIALNLTPVVRQGYRIGVPLEGKYGEVFNSDSTYYGGSNVGNGNGDLLSEELEWMNRPYSVQIDLPPLAGVVLAYQGKK